MVSYGMSGVAVLLCVFWLSDDSLKVASESSKGTALLMSASGGKGGRSGGEWASEAEIKAAQEGCKKALDEGKGAGATCDKTVPTSDGAPLDLLGMVSILVVMAKKSLEELVEMRERLTLTKDTVAAITNNVGRGRVGEMMCSVRKGLVCVGEWSGKCKACGDLTENEESNDKYKSVCDAADTLNGGGIEKGSLSLLIFGLTCVCVPILRSLFFT